MHLDLPIEHAPAFVQPARALKGEYREERPAIAISVVFARDTSDKYVMKVSHGSYGDIAHVNEILQYKALKLPSATKKWQQHVLNPLADTDVDALTETVEGVLDFVAEFGPKQLALIGLRADGVQCEHLATVLRATSVWRDEIEGWNDALQTAKLATEATGMEPEDVLFGMV